MLDVADSKSAAGDYRRQGSGSPADLQAIVNSVQDGQHLVPCPDGMS